jgi:hypothetical protein
LLAIESKYNSDLTKLRSDYSKKTSEINKRTAEEEVNNRRDTLNTIASLSTSGNKTLANIGKAAALTQIAFDTEKAVSSAYAWGTTWGGPPGGAAMGALAAAAMAVRAANVAGIKFEDGGIVPGSSFSGDRVQARVNSGEMILNRQQQAQLFDMANGQGSGNGITREEVAMMIAEVANRPVVIQIDGKEIINVTRNQLATGRSF